MKLNVFKKALQSGWKPDVNAEIKQDADITWFVQEDMYIVPSNKGAVQLDEADYESAKKYIATNVVIQPHKLTLPTKEK